MNRRPSLYLFLLLVTLFLLYGVQALFLGQLSPYPIFWSLLFLFWIALAVSWIASQRSIDVRSWLWFLPLVLLLDKLLFFPGLDLGDPAWLKTLISGFSALFVNGTILHAIPLAEAARGLPEASALFLLLGVLLWFPVYASLGSALRSHAWGWPVLTTLLFLVWLEPLPATSSLFIPLIGLLAAFFLFVTYRRRKDQLTENRMRHRTADLHYSFRWSLLILLPLLILIVPWAVARFSFGALTLPVLPDLTSGTSLSSTGGGSIVTPQGLLPDRDVPLYHLPPLEMPPWLEDMVMGGSTVLLIAAVILLTFFLMRMGRRLTLAYFAGVVVFLVLSLWLLPPIVGPLLQKLFYWLLLAWKSVRAALGLGPQALPGLTTTSSLSGLPQGGGTDPLTSLLGSLFASFSQSAAWMALVGIVLFLVIFFFAWRSIKRAKATAAQKKKDGIPSGPQAAWQGLVPSIFQLYFRLLQLLSRAGIVRQPEETPLEFAHRTEELRPEIELQLHELTGAFVLARYGLREPSPEGLCRLEESLRQAGDVLDERSEIPGDTHD